MDIPIKPGEKRQDTLLFEHPIGHGAYGQVWKVWHEKLEQPRAVKIIDIGNLDEINLKRVTNECKIGGQLGSDIGVVQVFDAFEHEGYLYIVMELMENGNLEKAIREKPYAFDVTLDWALELCEALAAVHACEIIHRDIKPKNILLSGKGHVKLSDFGIAHLPRSGITSYQPGTPGYRAPELETDGQVTLAADVYSLSAVFFELWSCRAYAPYRGLEEDVVRKEFLTCVETEYPEVPEDIRKNLIDLILKGLDQDPSRRINLEGLHRGLKEIYGTRGRSATELERERQVIALDLLPRRSATIVSPLAQIPQANASAPPGDTALVEWIAEEFGSWFMEEPEQEVILWFDPKSEWDTVLPLLDPYLDLIRDNGSLLEVRYKLEKRERGRQVVVYTPRAKHQADYLRPFIFTSRIFDKTLYQFLLEHNLPLPKYGKERQNLESKLSLLVQASRGKGRTFWEQIQSSKDAEALLVPNFQERVIQFIMNPVEVWRDLEREGLKEAFLQMVARRYGLSLEGEDPPKAAEKLFHHWILIDMFMLAGHPHDFPFLKALPHQMTFNECRNDLNAFRHDSRYIEIFLERIEAFERRNPSLLVWAKDQKPLMQDPPLMDLARGVWEGVLMRMEAWEERGRVLTELHDLQDEIQRGVSSYWFRHGVIPEWAVLFNGSSLILKAHTASESAAKLDRPQKFIEEYVEKWWYVDKMYRAFHESLSSSAELPNLRRWVDHFYESFLERTNMCWTQALSGSKDWPPKNCGTVSYEASSSLWAINQRRAIFVIDALRYELAKDLEGHLKGENIQFECWVAALPSTTPIGMAALLPQADKLNVDWDDGWVITLPEFAKNLGDKTGRVAWLQEASPNLLSTSLADFLKPDYKLSDDVETLVVFADELDAWGESASELSITAFAGLVDNVSRGIRKTLDLGFESTHVVTDHGFILLGQVQEHGKIEVEGSDSLKLSHRYLIGRTLSDQEGLLRFPVVGSKDLVGLYPPGVACFKAGGKYNYAHGGLSLQEIILPYLRIQQDISYVPVSVELLVEDRIFSGVFKVSLLPKKQTMFVKEREVSLIVENASGDEIYQSTEIVSPEEGVTKNIRLKPTDGVKLGDRMRLLIQDGLSGEEIAQKDVEVHVDLEL